MPSIVIKKSFFLILFVGLNTFLYAANYFWVNGSGNWSDLSHWATTSGGTVYHTQLPNENDDIYLDQNSFVEDNNQVHLDRPDDRYDFRNFDATGVTKQVVFTQDNFFIFMYINGGLLLSDLLNFNGSGYMYFTGSQNTMLIRTHGKLRTFILDFYGSGTFIQEDSLVAETVTIRGNYATQGNNISVVRGIALFARPLDTLDIRGSSIYVKGSSELTNDGIISKAALGTLLSNNETNIFWEASRGTFTIGSFALGDSLRFGRFEASDFLTLSLDEAVYFGKIDLNTSAELNFDGCTIDSFLLYPESKYLFGGASYRASAGAGGSFRSNIHYISASGECGRPISIQGLGRFEIRSTYPATLEHVILEDIILRPLEGDTDSEIGWTAIASADLGGVEGIQFTQGDSRTLYWVGGSGDWYDASHWSLQSGGVGGQCPPTPFDDVIIDGLSTDGAATITYNQLVNEGIGVAALCRSFDARQITSSIRIDITNLWLFGDVYLSPLLDYDVRLTRLSGWGDHQLHTADLEMPHLLMGGKGTYNLVGPLTMASKKLLVFRRGNLNSQQQDMHLHYIHYFPYTWDASYHFDFSRCEVVFSGNNLSPADYDGFFQFPYSQIFMGTELGYSHSGYQTNTIDGTVGSEAVWAHVSDNSTGLLLADDANIRVTSPNKILVLPNLALNCDIHFESTEGRGLLVSQQLRRVEPMELNKLSFASDGVLSGRIKTDSLIYAKGGTYVSTGARQLTVNKYFEAVGNLCKPITIQPQGAIAQYIFTDSTCFKTDYVHFSRARPNGRSDNPYFAGSNSQILNAAANNWTLAYDPCQEEIFSLSPGFLGADTLYCDTIDIQSLLPLVPPDFEATYVWQDSSRSPTYLPPGEGTYILAITFDEGSCTMLDTVEIDVSTLENIDWFPAYELLDVTCPAGEDGQVLVYTDSLAVRLGEAMHDPGEIADFNQLRPGTYRLEVTGPTGCAEGFDIELTALPPILTDLPEVLLIREERTASVSVRTQGGNAPYTYRWLGGDSTYLATQTGSDQVFSSPITQRYDLEISDALGCLDTASVLVVVDRPKRHFLPTAFSPNFDGINDRLEVYGEAATFEVISMQVHDRWGGLLYEAKNFRPDENNQGWDGYHRGQAAAAGSYLVYLRLRWSDGLETQHSQMVQLMR